MVKFKDRLVERRKYIRLRANLQLTYTIPQSRIVRTTSAKNISADGIRFETHEKELAEGQAVELKLEAPGAFSPIHAKGIVIWKRKLSLEDNAPYDVGIEFTEIEEDNKNTFLKFLCDLIYNLPKEGTYGDEG